MGNSRWLRPRSRRFSDTLQAYLYLIPVFAIIGIFTYYAFGNAIYLSFQKVYPVAFVNGEIVPFHSEFVGLQNYQRMFADRDFHRALLQTSTYVGLSVPITILVALILASFLNQKLRMRPFYRLACFIPYITPVVAISMVWQWIFNTRSGLLNYFLGLVGIPVQDWLQNPALALICIVIINVWRFAGFHTVIFLAGMQGIDRTYYEAAKIDGASSLQAWRKVTLPLLTPQIFFVFVISIMGSFRVFDEIFILFSGSPGPRRSALTLVYYLFRDGFQRYEYGRAAAASVILFLIVLFFTIIQFAITQRRVHYDQ